MACAVPVVVTPFVGLSDDLGRADREFRLCERSPEALATTLTELLGDSVARTTLGTAGRSWVEERLPLNASVTRHVELYEELVAAYRAPPSNRR
jgi:glycosyltransferase involved in cell wall biosynthesis